MNALGYYNELDETEEENQPSAQPNQQTESDKARAWFESLDLDGMKNEDKHESEFFKYQVTVYRAERAFYLSTRSPQQRIYRRTFPTMAARGTAEDIKAGFERFLREMESKRSKHTAQRDAKRQARAQFVNPYNVGDFLYSSWGYDQTNREFYQILETRSTSIKIREVAQDRTRTGFDSGTCSPRRDQFIEAAQWVTIQIDERGHHGVPSPIHGILHSYEGKPVYFSDGH